MRFDAASLTDREAVSSAPSQSLAPRTAASARSARPSIVRRLCAHRTPGTTDRPWAPGLRTVGDRPAPGGHSPSPSYNCCWWPELMHPRSGDFTSSAKKSLFAWKVYAPSSIGCRASASCMWTCTLYTDPAERLPFDQCRVSCPISIDGLAPLTLRGGKIET